MSGDFYVLLGMVWVGTAIWGILWLMKKGYLANTTCAVWGVVILFGWWAIPLILGLGPIWLAIAAKVEGKKRCPHCRSMIPESATRCASCQADLVERSTSLVR